MAVCLSCPFLNPFIVPGTCTRSFILSALGCPAGPRGLTWFQSHAQHEDEFVLPLNKHYLSRNHIALNFFPSFGGFPAPGSTAAGVGCCEHGRGREGGCNSPGRLGTAAARHAVPHVPGTAWGHWSLRQKVTGLELVCLFFWEAKEYIFSTTLATEAGLDLKGQFF